MKIFICVGSSCYLKGSYDVIQKMKSLIKKYNVEDKVELKASLCLGQCEKAVNIKVDEIFVHGLSPENTEKYFLENIYPRLLKE